MNDFPASIKANNVNLLGNLANYSDIVFLEKIEDTSHEDDLFKTIVGIAVITLAVLGILTNILVLILSFCHVTGDFGNFVANLAVVDIVCGAVFAFMGYINVQGGKMPFSIGLMVYSVFIFYGSFGVMVCALVPISLSRVISLTKPHLSNWLFSGRRSIAICVLFDVIPIVALICMNVTVGKEHKRWLNFAYTGLTILSYIVAFLLNYIVFRIVARHIRVVQNLRDHVRLLETRQIALATFAQAIIPLICQVPAFLSWFTMRKPMTSWTVTAIAQLGVAANPLLDALITITVIKQYRTEALACFSSLGKSACGGRKSSNLYDETKEVLETKL
ncbi:hypothetical protein Aduo_019329 [Ancylostoma duodenale]